MELKLVSKREHLKRRRRKMNGHLIQSLQQAFKEVADFLVASPRRKKMI